MFSLPKKKLENETIPEIVCSLISKKNMNMHE